MVSSFFIYSRRSVEQAIPTASNRKGIPTSCPDQEGRKGSEEGVPENLGVPLEGDRDFGALGTLDAHFINVSPKEFEYNVIDYYFSIPSDEVSKSEYIDQQPNR